MLNSAHEVRVGFHTGARPLLLNPFTPAEIASSPEDFFGRDRELRTLERSLRKGSLVIQGPIGIGKSSLLARGLLTMEGFNGGDGRAKSVTAVGKSGHQHSRRCGPARFGGIYRS